MLLAFFHTDVVVDGVVVVVQKVSGRQQILSINSPQSDSVASRVLKICLLAKTNKIPHLHSHAPLLAVGSSNTTLVGKAIGSSNTTLVGKANGRPDVRRREPSDMEP